MTDEDETTSSGIIVATERVILEFLRDREAKAAAPEDHGTSIVNQVADKAAVRCSGPARRGLGEWEINELGARYRSIRIIKHEAVTGSFEVRFSDWRPSV